MARPTMSASCEINGCQGFDLRAQVARLEAANAAKDAALRAIKDRDWLKLIDIAGLANHEELGLLSAYELEGDFEADVRHHFPARMQLFKAVAGAALFPDAGKGWSSHLAELDGAADGLRALADWFDVDDEQKGRPADKDEMQRDLRRWAAALDALKGVE